MIKSLAFLASESRSNNERMKSTESGTLQWIAKGLLAVLDQVLISGSNFAVAILLARWLAPKEYGAYEFAQSIFFMLALVLQSVILEPMSVFGPSKYKKTQRHYLGALLWLHAAIASLIFLVLGTLGIITLLSGGSPSLAGAFAGISFAGPCVLLFWLVRCAFYMRLKPLYAVLGSLCYSAFLLGMLLLLDDWWTPTPFAAFLLMAIGAILTSAFLLILLKPNMRFKTCLLRPRHVYHDHWIYGRWAFASSVAKWIPWNLHLILMGAISGLAGVADIKALINLALPAAQGFTALSLLALPYASRTYDLEGPKGMAKVARRLTMLFSIGAVAYGILISLLAKPILLILYKGNYMHVAPLVFWIALAMVFSIAAFGPTIALRAMQAPSLVFVAYSLSSAVALLMGIPFIRWYGLKGAVIVIVVSNLVLPLVSIFLFYTRIKGTSFPLRSIGDPQPSALYGDPSSSGESR